MSETEAALTNDEPEYVDPSPDEPQPPVGEQRESPKDEEVPDA